MTIPRIDFFDFLFNNGRGVRANQVDVNHEHNSLGSNASAEEWFEAIQNSEQALDLIVEASLSLSRWKGVWKPATYALGDEVLHSGNYHRRVSAGTDAGASDNPGNNQHDADNNPTGAWSAPLTGKDLLAAKLHQVAARVPGDDPAANATQFIHAVNGVLSWTAMTRQLLYPALKSMLVHAGSPGASADDGDSQIDILGTHAAAHSHVTRVEALRFDNLGSAVARRPVNSVDDLTLPANPSAVRIFPMEESPLELFEAVTRQTGADEPNPGDPATPATFTLEEGAYVVQTSARIDADGDAANFDIEILRVAGEESVAAEHNFSIRERDGVSERATLLIVESDPETFRARIATTRRAIAYSDIEVRIARWGGVGLPGVDPSGPNRGWWIARRPDNEEYHFVRPPIKIVTTPWGAAQTHYYGTLLPHAHRWWLLTSAASILTGVAGASYEPGNESHGGAAAWTEFQASLPGLLPSNANRAQWPVRRRDNEGWDFIDPPLFFRGDWNSNQHYYYQQVVRNRGALWYIQSPTHKTTAVTGASYEPGNESHGGTHVWALLVPPKWDEDTDQLNLTDTSNITDDGPDFSPEVVLYTGSSPAGVDEWLLVEYAGFRMHGVDAALTKGTVLYSLREIQNDNISTLGITVGNARFGTSGTPTGETIRPAQIKIGRNIGSYRTTIYIQPLNPAGGTSIWFLPAGASIKATRITTTNKLERDLLSMIVSDHTAIQHDNTAPPAIGDIPGDISIHGMLIFDDSAASISGNEITATIARTDFDLRANQMRAADAFDSFIVIASFEGQNALQHIRRTVVAGNVPGTAIGAAAHEYQSPEWGVTGLGFKARINTPAAAGDSTAHVQLNSDGATTAHLRIYGVR